MLRCGLCERPGEHMISGRRRGRGSGAWRLCGSGEAPLRMDAAGVFRCSMLCLLTCLEGIEAMSRYIGGEGRSRSFQRDSQIESNVDTLKLD
jgi:hypothetical protein